MAQTQKPLSQKLLAWYDQQGRKNLPWRQQITPYRVWISEVMLQQTQVKTVIPYFERFMARFPSLTELALASEDEVLQLWTGLGYYARGRNLHKAAQQVYHVFNGQLPKQIQDLESLSGIGRSTAGAILAISDNQPTAILDGNVKRILSRLHAVSEEITQSKALSKLWAYAQDHTPKQRCADYTQAIMDLGALICTRSRPQCSACPLQSDCQAYRQGKAEAYPIKKRAQVKPIREIQLLICERSDTGEILLQKRPPSGIWGGLWSLPECAVGTEIKNFCLQNYGYRIKENQILERFRHTFTHFHLMITPMNLKGIIDSNRLMDDGMNRWTLPNQHNELGLPAPIKKLLDEFAA